MGRIDEALSKAAQFLVQRQSADGAWRSQTYGLFKDGPSLTPFVMNCLYFIISQGGKPASAAYRKGTNYLVKMVRPDGGIKAEPYGLRFPVLTAASACRVVVLQERTPATLRAQAAWLACLRRYQLNRKLGWEPSDPEFGGWGFALEPPRKPGLGEPYPDLYQSNLVATIFGIGGLTGAHVPSSDPAYAEALTFVERCQNFPANGAPRDPRFDDGGFFFIPRDPGLNKAGVAGTDAAGNVRFRSYGSMTADGLRALLRCGLAPDSPRVVAARRWLEWNFSVAIHPGDFPPDRIVLRDGTYYYYVWAAAHAFLQLKCRQIETRAGKVDWAEALANELLRRQRPDGAWINPCTDSKEDDPLVGSSWAAATLAICRATLSEAK